MRKGSAGLGASPGELTGPPDERIQSSAPRRVPCQRHTETDSLHGVPSFSRSEGGAVARRSMWCYLLSAGDRVVRGCVVRETLGMVANGWLESGHRGRMTGRPPIVAGARSSREGGFSCAWLDSLGISGTGKSAQDSSHQSVVSYSIGTRSVS